MSRAPIAQLIHIAQHKALHCIRASNRFAEQFQEIIGCVCALPPGSRLHTPPRGYGGSSAAAELAAERPFCRAACPRACRDTAWLRAAPGASIPKTTVWFDAQFITYFIVWLLSIVILKMPIIDKDEVESELSKLIRKRGSIRGRLTKLDEYVQETQKLDINSALSSVNIKELGRRLDSCQELFRQFDSIQTLIENNCNESAVDEQITLRDLIETKFISIMSIMEDILERQGSEKDKIGDACSNKCSHATSSSHGLQSIKLPTIKLPIFNGSYLKWLEFRDTFQSLIHCNESIPGINKFHYLRSSLEGGAIEVIKSLEFTSENYKVAWELLCDRYNNKKILINNHLKALCSIETLTKESFKELRNLVDIVSKNLRALNTLGQPTDQWDTLLIFMVTGKLDTSTSVKWEEHRNILPDLPTLNDFFKFIRSRADILETTSVTSQQNKNEKGYFNKNSQANNWKNKQLDRSTSFVSSVENLCEYLCLLCSEQGHRIHQCTKFKNMNVQDRLKEASKFKLCSNCLREGHNSFHCRMKVSCKFCKQKHNTLLHVNKPQSSNSTDRDLTTATPSTSTQPLPVSLSAVSVSQVLLCTAMVEVINVYTQQTYLVRALLDTGSQSSFVTDNLKNKLGLSTKITEPLRISGINNISFNISERCNLNIKSRLNSFNLEINCLIVPQITGTLPSAPVNIQELNLPENIVLADPKFHYPSNIDILLGADVFWNIVGTKRISLGVGKPILQYSQFGWLVSGRLGECSLTHLTCNFTKEIHNDLQKFWEVEEINCVDNISPQDKLCEQHFLENMKRLPNGRFSVKMPFKEIPEQALGNSYFLAKKRFLNLEKKLNNNSQLKQSYTAFIEEYKNLGHLNEIKRPIFGYYLPHHAVLREQSETTKLRVVFDASAKTNSGKSLNDIQYVGPVVQDDLLSILLRFRTYKYVLTGDIQKMYRQIEIDPSQRHLQLILWRDDYSQPIKVLQLNTVTYGTASAPFLSTRCLVQLARECSHPIISNILEHDIYMDDLNTGCQSEEEIKEIYEEVTRILSSACFPLHKIRTNCPKVLQTETTSKTLDLSKYSTVLGLNWSPSPDTLHFTVDMDMSRKLTKRTIISLTCKIFDPLGLLCACIIKAKIILQLLWKEKLGWDDPVPPHIEREWVKISENINNLSKISLPRYVLCDFPISVELHCFVDASQEAYGACVYLRSINNDNVVNVNLLCAKARVTPLKALTIPRLELCGALLGARLSTKVIQSIRCHKITQKVIWTDSTVVLGWINAQPNLLKAFVANRVIEINELTQGFTWRHVPTHLNPADLASRGVDPQRLQFEPLWWEGPSFLKEGSSAWPQHPHMSVELPELKVHIQTEVDNDDSQNSIIDFKKYSKFSHLSRVCAYVLRFLHNCRNKTKLDNSLQASEINKAISILCKICQNDSFVIELKSLNKGLEIPKKSKIFNLNPFLDSDGLLRVGGRLDNSSFDYNKKHPIILDCKHRLTFLLMQNEHHRLFHAGPQLLLSSVREMYWPVGGRALARKVNKQCTVCTRFRGKTIQPIMGNLPSARTRPNFPFHSTGTDFAGPFQISSKKGRGNRISKCYLCLFVCLSTRAVHLELVSDLTTSVFILCLRRFVSRRGKPYEIWCDNGTNFVGANNELGRVLRSSRDSVIDYATDEGILFKFSPAYSPHFGGLWEAGVKAAKYHLKRTAANVSLTFEELSTLFTQIEAILNSRPLSPLSSDPLDLNPLTPGHFLIGRPLTSVPSFTAEDSRPKYHLICKLRLEFWKRWSQEYIAELQQRSKWKTGSIGPRIGDMVLIKDQNLPPQRWRLGRITRLHMGADNICRVVDIYTSRGTIRRAIHYIVRLPGEEEPVES